MPCLAALDRVLLTFLFQTYRSVKNGNRENTEQHRNSDTHIADPAAAKSGKRTLASEHYVAIHCPISRTFKLLVLSQLPRLIKGTYGINCTVLHIHQRTFVFPESFRKKYGWLSPHTGQQRCRDPDGVNSIRYGA